MSCTKKYEATIQIQTNYYQRPKISFFIPSDEEGSVYFLSQSTCFSGLTEETFRKKNWAKVSTKLR